MDIPAGFFIPFVPVPQGVIHSFEIKIFRESTREKWSGEHQFHTDRIGVGRRLADYKDILRRKVRMPADCSDGKERKKN